MAVSLYDYNEGQSDLSILVSRVYNIQEEKSLEDQHLLNEYKISTSSSSSPKISRSPKRGNQKRLSASDQNVPHLKKFNSSPRKSIMAKSNAFENITEEDEESLNSTNTKYNGAEEYADGIYEDYFNSKNSRNSQRSRKSNSSQEGKINQKESKYSNGDDVLSSRSKRNSENHTPYQKNPADSFRLSNSSNSIFHANKRMKDLEKSQSSEKRIQDYLDFEDDDENLGKLSSSDIDDILRRISPISRKLQYRIVNKHDSSSLPQLDIAEIKGKRLSFDQTDSDTTDDTDIYSNYNENFYNSKSSSLKTSNSSEHSKKRQNFNDNPIVSETELKNNSEFSEDEINEDDREIALMLKNAHIGNSWNNIGKHKKSMINKRKSQKYLMSNDSDHGYNTLIDKKIHQSDNMKSEFSSRVKPTSKSTIKPKTIFDELSDEDYSYSNNEDSLPENCFGKDNYDINSISSKVPSETKEIIERMKTIRNSENGLSLSDENNTKKSLVEMKDSSSVVEKSSKTDRKLNTGISTNTSISILKHDETRSNQNKYINLRELSIPKSLEVADNMEKTESKFENKPIKDMKVLSTFTKQSPQIKSSEELDLTPTRKARFERYSNDKVRGTSPVRDLINKHVDTINKQNMAGTLEVTPELANYKSKNIMRSPKSINTIASKFENNINQNRPNPSGDNIAEKFVIPKPDSKTAISATKPNIREPQIHLQSKNLKAYSEESNVSKKMNSDTGAGMRGMTQRIPLSIQKTVAVNSRSDLKTTSNKETKSEQKLEEQSPSSPKKAISDIKNKFDNLIQRFQKKESVKDTTVHKAIITKNPSEKFLSSPTVESNRSIKEPISPLQQNNLFDEEPDFAKAMEKNKFKLRSNSPIADKRKLFETPEEAQFKEIQRRIVKNKS